MGRDVLVDILHERDRNLILNIHLSHTNMEDTLSWFKVTILVTNSDDPKTYQSRCIGHVSADTQNKMIKIPKNY